MVIPIYIALNAVLFVISVFGFLQVRQFLNQTPVISGPAHIDAFKRLVRTNMYLAVVVLCLALPSLLLTIYIAYAVDYGFFIAIAFSVPSMLFSKYAKTFDERARNLACDAAYDAEHKRIAQAWGKSLLPDF